MVDTYTRTAVGGSDIQVILEFPTLIVDGAPAILNMGSVVTVSYSVYRTKTPVFSLGQPLINGLGLGNKYVAGSLIGIMFDIEEISNFINEYVASNEDSISSDENLTGTIEITTSTYKEIHTVMKDDLTSFNIHCLMDDEYYGADRARRVIIYDAQFVTSGQVMSIDDIVTEYTTSFIARDIREQHRLTDDITSLSNGAQSYITASDLL